MPTFDFTSPEGKTYSVDGPDGATKEQAFQILQQHLGTAPQEDAGVIKQLGYGLAQGVAGLAGLPADLAHLYAPNQSDPNPLGSEALSKKLLGDVPAPQGAVENIVNKIGQFAPAMIGGPESLAAKAATRVVAPAVASEVGKDVAGPYGEVAGALVGAGGATAAANKFKAMAAARNAANVAPSVDELKNAARAGYQSPDVAAVRINPGAVDNLATTIESDLTNQGFRPNNQKDVFGVVNELKGAPGPVQVADLDSARKALGVTAKEVDAVGKPTASAVAAQKAIGHIDNFLPNLNQSDLLAGDASKANQILSEARSNWGAAKRAEQAQTLLSNAELNAASANSGGNIQNSIKQAFKPLARNNYAKAGGYNDAERAALDRVVRGTWTGSAARAAGNLLGGGGGLGMLAGGAAGYEAGGVPGAIAAGLAGRGLKIIGNRSTFNAVKQLDQLLRARSPAALKLAATLPPAVINKLPKKSAAILAAISADSALRQPVPTVSQ